MSWLTGWTYRRQVVVNNSSNANTLTDYQVSKLIDTATLISAGKMQSDCRDIRFTDTDGVTLLSFWIESGTNTSSTKTWIKTPSIAANSNKTIYMYYGNAAAASTSSGVNTFDVFDDFDPDKVAWQVLSGTWSNVAGYQGNSKKGVYDSAEAGAQSICGGSLSLADFVLQTKTRSTVDNSIVDIIFRAADGINNGLNRLWVRLDQRPIETSTHNGGFHCREDINGTKYVRGYYDFDPVLSQWYDMVIKVHGTTVEGFLDGVLRWTATVTKTTAGYLLLQIAYVAGYDAWFDNYFIRKYTATEPTATIGTEEVYVAEQILDNAILLGTCF